MAYIQLFPQRCHKQKPVNGLLIDCGYTVALVSWFQIHHEKLMLAVFANICDLCKGYVIYVMNRLAVQNLYDFYFFFFFNSSCVSAA